MRHLDEAAKCTLDVDYQALAFESKVIRPNKGLHRHKSRRPLQSVDCAWISPSAHQSATAPTDATHTKTAWQNARRDEPRDTFVYIKAEDGSQFCTRGSECAAVRRGPTKRHRDRPRDSIDRAHLNNYFFLEKARGPAKLQTMESGKC